VKPVFSRSKTAALGSGGIDRLLSQGVASFRRRIIAGATVAVLLLAAISIALAWRQYEDARSRAMNDLESRVLGVSAILDTTFAGQIATLNAISQAPSVVSQESLRMNDYFARVNPRRATPFSGGLGWIDRKGLVLASSTPGNAVNLSTRLYFRRVLATGKPYVSAGLIGKRLKQPIVVVAVPTRDQRGRVSGVLAGSILLKTVATSKQAIALGYGDLRIIDRDGQLLLSGLRPVQNKALLAQIDRAGAGAGVLRHSPGLDGRGDDVVAFATSKVPGWVTVIDRPRSTVFAAALRALVLELASVGAGVLLILVVMTFLVWRSRRESETQNERARSWGGLTRALGSAATPSEIADALLSSLATAFKEAAAVVAFEHSDGVQVKAESPLRQARRLLQSTSTLELIAPLGREGANSRLIERDPSLREAYILSGRRLSVIHSLPIPGPDDQPAGTIALVSAEERLGSSEWDLLGSFADQAANALERARRFAHEHELAVRLQQSLLPDHLPSAEGVELAGHYLAGGDAVQVGGDWYDAVRRPDGIIQLCVGDVSGKGIGAATVMGRQRNVFHVYAHDYVSPAEIIRRMLRHVSGEELITLTCVSLDPYTGELSYSCAGHPPPLLVDRSTGEVVRLDRASAPPIGVAEPADITEAQVLPSEQAVLAMYTDGLIERRGQNIDDGIDLLGRLIVSTAAVTPDRIVRNVSEAIGAPDDDVALLLVSMDAARAGFEVEVPAEAATLPELRRRLRAWLARRHCGPAESADLVLAVSEACNNAIEHGYRDRDRGGTIKLSIEVDQGTIRAVVEDQGSWHETPGKTDERGRGITLMQHLMHTTEIESDANGTRVTLVLRVRAGRESGLIAAPATPSA
jgi:serine phosphatase RsbU (regulator of sigma subunit)/anti-sigma regulatory factor (Ser/Thr protein kinase)